MHAHNNYIHIHLVYATDHVWMLYFFVCLQCNAKNKTWEMPSFKHANEATKKMKNAFSYESEKLFSANQILYILFLKFFCRFFYWSALSQSCPVYLLLKRQKIKKKRFKKIKIDVSKSHPTAVNVFRSLNYF